MPKEMIILGGALIFGAWFVIDHRSFGEKMGFLLLILFLYVGYEWLSGHSLQDVLGQFTQFFHSAPPPSE